MEREILLLGDERLYDVSLPVARDELEQMKPVAEDLRDTLYAFRRKYGVGRAIAAPQIGVFKRVLYMEAEGVITALINPVLTFPDDERMIVLDDCMSFPNLLVRVSRYRRCEVRFWDAEGADRRLSFEGDLSELIQHEYDHLDGILATMRMVGERALSLRRGAAAAEEAERRAIRYRHTNLIAEDWRALSGFYQRALGLVPTGHTRDLSGDWVDRLTGIPGAHITGEHLKMPGADETLELFSYDEVLPGAGSLNRAGFAHIAFEVDDVPGALEKALSEGAAPAGEVVSVAYPGGVTATFVYITDPEGNLIELQHWENP